jgi:hypothetical protein
MPLWDSTGITSTGVKTHRLNLNIMVVEQEKQKATTKWIIMFFSSATETDAHFAVIADRNGALDNSKSYVLTELNLRDYLFHLKANQELDKNL